MNAIANLSPALPDVFLPYQQRLWAAINAL